VKKEAPFKNNTSSPNARNHGPTNLKEPVKC